MGVVKASYTRTRFQQGHFFIVAIYIYIVGDEIFNTAAAVSKGPYMLKEVHELKTKAGLPRQNRKLLTVLVDGGIVVVARGDEGSP